VFSVEEQGAGLAAAAVGNRSAFNAVLIERLSLAAKHAAQWQAPCLAALLRVSLFLHRLHYLPLPQFLMTWLPSYVKLFLLLIGGFVLQLGAGIAEMESMDRPILLNVFGYLRLFGLVLLVVSPLLIILKFFAQLDRRTE